MEYWSNIPMSPNEESNDESCHLKNIINLK